VEPYPMKRVVASALSAALLLVFAGCGWASPVLFITGDCEGTAVGASYLARFSLEEMVAAAKPRAAEFDLLLIGNDGLVARIPGGDLSGCALVYSGKYAWELRSESHPPSANVKNLAKIAVVSTAEDPHAARFPQGSVTAGQLLLLDSLRALREEGTSRKNGRSVTVYTTRWRVPLAQLCPAGELLAESFGGEAVRFFGTENCYLESAGNRIDLLLPNGNVVKDLSGVTAEAREGS
jgi:hypothetical protein